MAVGSIIRRSSALFPVLLIACDLVSNPPASTDEGIYILTLVDRRPLPYVSDAGDSLLRATLELKPGGDYAALYTEVVNPTGQLHITTYLGTWSVGDDSLRFVNPSGGLNGPLRWACKRTGDILGCVGSTEWQRQR
jgi:hypothetical protein